MSYTNFRNAYLTEAENRLAAIDVATATTHELLAAGALYKMAAAVAEADLIGPSALRLLEAMSGAQLQSWLQDLSNRDAFERILASPEAMRAVAASQTALAAIRQSSTAISAINASSQALDILYNAATKFTYAGGAWSANPATLVTGNFLLVRIRQLNNPAGWGEGNGTGQYIRIGGSGWTASSGQSTNGLINRTSLPHVYDNALRAVNGTSIQYVLCNSYEIAYLAA